MIDQSFISYAADILADTDTGLSGSKLVKYCNKYAVKYSVSIPYGAYPFPNGTPNKRTVLSKNLQTFKPEQQYALIQELCNIPEFADNERVIDLSNKLISHYPQFAKNTEYIPEFIEETRDWLDKYPKVQKYYQSALLKKDSVGHYRNSLDDLRLSFEIFLKELLQNEKSIENQKSKLGVYLNNKKISKEIRNSYVKISELVDNYQNNHIKHGDGFKEVEIDLIFELTTVLMRFLIKLNGR
ncbi:hypothetical protein HMPREF9123_1438 [Neisseria bacilliformis ATCC BAA-1200]|uniref:Uncharacterized protein n=1 Tax=Neisseria bacilliformis ATCC BAA-1200 TaxID=888742 RepID=F2BCI3_9NEIS|nr:hypothetical protein [Neisseria bacilliformis]EGF10967.1 hypothetical protein HMPREF9123_1438 [Neisseria bacilliformis ATCC BAA-1200]QMT48440.1 hypothetical protein H3L91_04875 [Neisseria bacilliformis]